MNNKYILFKRAVSLTLIFSLIAGMTSCGFSSGMEKATRDKTDEEVYYELCRTAEGFYPPPKSIDNRDLVCSPLSVILSSATEHAESGVSKLKHTVSSISLPDFKQGFETAASIFGTTVASLKGQAYVEDVASAIGDLEKNIASRFKNGPIASNAGKIAEEWHAGTFNIDAAAKGSKLRALVPKSNKLNSADVTIGDDIQASMKYYKTAEQSAKQQAKNYVERYHEYVSTSKSKSPMSMQEWLDDRQVNLSADSPEMYWSCYKDQVRIIPSDQLEEAKACLEKAVKSNAAKDSTNRKYVSEADLETLENLTDRLKAADGTESIPLSKEEAEAIAKSAQEGNFSAKDLGLTTENAICDTYIARQALKAGATSAIIECAVVLGPEIYEIIKCGIETGDIDEEKLKTTGIDGLSAAGDGFLKGSISNALVVMCQAGKLGAEYTNPSPEMIGAATVLVIDSIRYGIMLSKGEISTAEYVDVLAQEFLVSVGSLGASAVMGLLFPQATLAILLGSFVGGLVVSAGYPAGKTYALALIQSSDVDFLVPVEATAEAISGITETTKIKVEDAISAIKRAGKTTAQNVTIKVYDLKEII